MQVDHFTLILDTDHYAGNFERETTAYATGTVGDCGVGEELAKEFHAMGVDQALLDEIEDKMHYESDEHGCNRPCAIQTTPGWVNDGNGQHYRQDKSVPPSPEQIEKYRDHMRKYKLPHLESARKSTATGYGGWTQEGLDREEKAFQDIDTSMPRWFPAYNSVGIFFSEKPSDEALKLVVTRAKEYLTRKGVALEGVRLITEFTDSSEETLNVL
jgi:hypothetical protein